MATTTKSGARRRKTIEAIVTVVKFTDSSRPFEVVRPESSLAEFQPIHGGDYYGKGYDTPLRDATAHFVAYLESLRRPNRVVIGLMADETGSMHGNEAAVIQGINDFVTGMGDVKAIDPKTAGTVLAVVATDGGDNAPNQEISPEALRSLVASKEQDGYTFIFLGAQIDAWSIGRSTLGLSGGVRGQTISYRNTPRGTAAAFGNITTDSKGYLADSALYASNMSGQTMKSVTEDGSAVSGNINASQGGGGVALPTSVPFATSSPYSNVDEALKTARGVTTTTDPEGDAKLREKGKKS